jgi:hypothetical protein
MVNLIFFLESVFSFWLLLDALRRRASLFWIVMILLPFGEWVYFFKVKAKDPEMARLLRGLGSTSRVESSLQPLREALQATPSYTNTLALAQALKENGEFTEAAELFRRALLRDGDSKEARYGLGESLLGAKHFAEASIELEAVIALDPAFRDYGAWAHLAYCLWQEGKKEEVFHHLARLVELSPRLNHRMLYAHYLRQEGRREEASQQLSVGLQEYADAPAFLQGHNEVWVQQARQMLKEVSGDRSVLSRFST